MNEFMKRCTFKFVLTGCRLDAVSSEVRGSFRCDLLDAAGRRRVASGPGGEMDTAGDRVSREGRNV